MTSMEILDGRRDISGGYKVDASRGERGVPGFVRVVLAARGRAILVLVRTIRVRPRPRRA